MIRSRRKRRCFRGRTSPSLCLHLSASFWNRHTWERTHHSPGSSRSYNLHCAWHPNNQPLPQVIMLIPRECRLWGEHLHPSPSDIILWGEMVEIWADPSVLTVCIFTLFDHFPAFFLAWPWYGFFPQDRAMYQWSLCFWDLSRFLYFWSFPSNEKNSQ